MRLAVPTPDRYFATLRAAGGRVSWYQPIRWYTLKRFNNRTHREIIVVDGTIGFIGGAGIASHWLEPKRSERPWRDTMLRVSGNLVVGLQTAFAENWIESTGEVLADATVFPEIRSNAKERAGLVVIGTPSPARSSPARVLFQVLLASARKSIDINSPYFLPDPSARRELIAAAGRGVRIRIITPGSANNHPIARRASRRRYGELLKAGVEIYEYQPGMIHAKILILDSLWSVVGSTNFDSRSFDLNDEINVAVTDRELAARLTVDFETRSRIEPAGYVFGMGESALGRKSASDVGAIPRASGMNDAHSKPIGGTGCAELGAHYAKTHNHSSVVIPDDQALEPDSSECLVDTRKARTSE